jgi:hypothetical protein
MLPQCRTAQSVTDRMTRFDSRKSKISSLLLSIQTSFHPLVTGRLESGIRPQRRKADHLPPSSAEVEMVKLICTSEHVVITECLIN